MDHEIIQYGRVIILTESYDRAVETVETLKAIDKKENITAGEYEIRPKNER